MGIKYRIWRGVVDLRGMSVRSGATGAGCEEGSDAFATLLARGEKGCEGRK